MSLSDNIKRLRIEKDLTQEQLAERFCISAQAISKWERSDTYPDGALLVPLAKELGVSLDELFDNDSVTMADISGKIIRLICNTEENERFNVVRDICWQIEKGLFLCHTDIDNKQGDIYKKYDPDEIKKQEASSYILDNNGFTVVSNGKEPFFSVFPQPEEGYGDFLNEKDELQKIFAALSHTDTMNALAYLYHKNKNYVFEASVLAKESNIAGDKIEGVLEDLVQLKIIFKKELTVNGEERTLYYSRPSHKIIALLIMAKEVCYNGGHGKTGNSRNTPFFKE